MRLIKTILSVEFLFALFLFAGYFKSILTFVPIDLTILLLLVTFTMAMFNLYKGMEIKAWPIVIWLSILVLALASMLYTEPLSLTMGVAQDKFIRLAIISTWCFIGPLLIIKDRESIKRFVYGVISLGIIMGIASFLPSERDSGFVDVFGSNYQSLSRITGSTSLVLIGIYLFSKKNVNLRLLCLSISMILIIPMMMSGGRLASLLFLIILFGIFPLMFSFLDVKNNTFKIYKRVFSYLFLLVVSVIILTLTIRTGILDTFLYRIEVIFIQEGGGSSIIGRTDRIAIALDMIYSNPFLGHGIGSFGFHYLMGSLNDDPHNIFLEIWAEMGIVTLLLFLIIFSSGIKNIIQLWLFDKKDWVYTSIFILTVFWVISAFISSGLTSGKILFAFLGVSIASYFAISKNNKS